MIIAIAASEDQKHRLLLKGYPKDVQINWIATSQELYLQQNIDGQIDCMFDSTTIPITNKPLLIHAPIHTLQSIQATENIARFCAWSGFIERQSWEIAMTDTANNDLINMMRALKWDFQIVKDLPGLIAPRIIATIINEAYFALEENISSKNDINLAMRLGTNYPYGPFEWAEKIGISNIHALLTHLSKTNAQYLPCPAMRNDL